MGLRAKPTYRQRRFGAEIRKLREQAGLTVGEGAAVMGMRQSHISNVESGRTGLSPERVRALAGAGGSEDSTFVDALVAMGQASGKGWWTEYRDRVRPSLLDVAELEAGARALHCYEPMFVPGLLQTPEYAAAIHRAGYVRTSRQEDDLAIEFRLKRQQVLLGESAPRLHAVVHEAALRSTLGSPRLMRSQLLRLIELSRLPNVTLQIMPFDGPVPFGTSFSLVGPEVWELSTVIVGHVEKSFYLDDRNDLARYGDAFAKVCEVALPPVDATVLPEAHGAKDSLGLIQRLLYPLL